MRDLGLVVVDEEHDSAYKQEGDPRYDARRVAARRAQQAGALLLVGSATPRAGELDGAARASTLPERVDGRSLPPVELLDMRGLRHALHPDSRAALDEVGRRGAKAIVLVNRRGWAPFVLCRSCGHGWTCPRCDVTLTLHRPGAHGSLLCHHCGHGEPAPSSCDQCGSTSLARQGPGPSGSRPSSSRRSRPMPVFRLDRDAARRKGGIADLLDRFRRAPSGVLVGTQMVAQGHDFPEVELAIVQDADAHVALPRLPLGGAHLLPRRAARRPQRPRARRRPRAGADAVPGLAHAFSTPPATTRRHSWPRRSSAAALCATRRSRR